VASITKQNRIHWLIENMLTYDRTFGKHNINVVGMYSAEQSQFDRLRVVARDIPHEEFQYFNLGHANGEITVSPGDQGYEQWGLMSYMGRAMYSYDDRYMLTATLRSDGSSRLAPGHKWHTYPAVSAGWNIAQESFMRNISQINVLKIRLGYGITSNQAVAPYMTLGNLSTRPYNFGSEFATGYLVSRAPNPQLGWEFSKTTNVALDFTILNNRLSGTFEYYRTNTYDLLLDKELHPASGLGNVMENIGTSQNKGVEISLNGRVLDNHNGWTWDIGFNLYANRNEITSLRSGFKRNEGNWWFVGHPIDVIYDYKAIGLWQDGDPHREILEPGANTLGMIKVEYTGEYNDDGTPVRAIGPEDRQIMSMLPNFQGGFNTRVTYRNFDFTIVGAFKNGGILNSTLYGGGGYMNLLNGRNGNVDVDYWTPENTKAKYPNPESIRSGDNLKYANTMGYFDASYLKIRTMSLGYNFKKIGNTDARLRVYVTAQNPFVMFSPYHRESGMDPETNSYGNENAAVPMSYALRRVLTVGTNAPATRNYVLGVNFTF
jgi:TonB-linked SusC/RagA family outer membrane protein